MMAIKVICNEESTCYVTVYNTAEDEGYNVLPISSLSNEYYDIDFNAIVADTSISKNILALENNTVVDVLVNNSISNQYTLQKDELLKISEYKVDIKSNKPICYYISSKTNIDGDNCIAQCCTEELYEQILPSQNNGKNYIINSIHANNEYLVIIRTQEDNTCIEVDGKFYNLNSTESIQYYTTEKSIIRSSKNISVFRLFESNSCSNNDIGDPELFQCMSIDYLQKEAIFYTPNGYFQKYYLNIIVPKQSLDSIYLDNVNIESEFEKINEFYFAAEIPVSQGIHLLKASKGFQAICYGVSNSLSGPNSAGYNIVGDSYQLEYQYKLHPSYTYKKLCDNETFLYESYDTSSSFIWNDGIVSSKRLFTDSGLYIVTIENNCLGYQYQDTISIDKQNCLCTPNVPSAFSPNNDGKNDILEIEYLCSNQHLLVFKIFDRWGKLIYINNNNQKTWDGMSTDNTPCSPGSYLYTMKYRDDTGKEKSKSGIINIIK